MASLPASATRTLSKCMRCGTYTSSIGQNTASATRNASTWTAGSSITLRQTATPSTAKRPQHRQHSTGTYQHNLWGGCTARGRNTTKTLSEYKTSLVSKEKTLRHVQKQRTFTTTALLRQENTESSSSPTQTQTQNEKQENIESQIPPSRIWTFSELQELISSSLSSSSSSSSTQSKPKTIIIDVREPSEILGTGRIPTSKNLPISSAPDSFFAPADEFEERFGFEKPGADDRVVFYCKAGVRSRAAARLAGQVAVASNSSNGGNNESINGGGAFGGGKEGMIGEFPGSWVEWFEKGGKIERD